MVLLHVVRIILLMNKYVYYLRQSFVHLNWFEITLMSAIMLLAILSFIIKGEFGVNNFIAAVSAILGVFCVVLGAKGSITNWLFGIVECFLYTYIAISGHIYGDALQRMLYTLPMQFIGWHLWSKRERDDESTQIQTRYMTWKVRMMYLTITAVMVLAFGYVLKFVGPHLTNFFDYMHFKVQADYASQSQLWLDSTTTVLSVVTLFISVKAYVEQWYLWLFINICSILIWVQSSTDFSFMVVAKYSVYLINSFYGIYMWHKLSNK